MDFNLDDIFTSCIFFWTKPTFLKAQKPLYLKRGFRRLQSWLLIARASEVLCLVCAHWRVLKKYKVLNFPQIEKKNNFQKMNISFYKIVNSFQKYMERREGGGEREKLRPMGIKWPPDRKLNIKASCFG